MFYKLNHRIGGKNILLATGVTLSTATQLRVSGVFLGPGEFLIVFWMIIVSISLLNNSILIKMDDAVRLIFLFFGVCALSLYAGMIYGKLQSINIHVDQMHDSLAFLFIGIFSCSYVILDGDDKSKSLILCLWLSLFLFSSVFFISMFYEQIYKISFWYDSVRFRGLSKNPNQLALHLVALPFLTLYAASLTKSIYKRFCYALIFFVTVVIGLEVRSDALYVSWVSMAGVYMIWMSWNMIRWKAVNKLIGICAFLSVLIMAMCFWHLLYPKANEIVINMIAEGAQGSTRFRLWSNGLDAIGASPITGLGPGPHSGLQHAFGNYEAHNTVIDWGMSAGLLGIIMYILIIIYSIFRAIRTKNPNVLSIVLSLFIFSLFHYALRQPIFWFILISIMSLRSEDSKIKMRFIKEFEKTPNYHFG